MLLRRLARPLFATAFVAEGVDAARDPDPHVDRVDAAWRRLQPRLGLPDPPSREDLEVLARVHGVATAVAAGMLAIGRMPRTSALALALLTLPRAVVEAPVGEGAGERQGRFLTTLSLVGGALLAAADTAGRPGLAWRVQHTRLGKEAAREARIAVLEARRDARHAVDQARRQARSAATQAATATARTAGHATRGAGKGAGKATAKVAKAAKKGEGRVLKRAA